MDRLRERTRSGCTMLDKGTGAWAQVVPRFKVAANGVRGGSWRGGGGGAVVARDRNPEVALVWMVAGIGEEAKYKNIWEKRSARLQCY